MLSLYAYLLLKNSIIVVRVKGMLDCTYGMFVSKSK